MSNPKLSLTASTEQAGRIAALSALCTDAAKHVAQARIALFSERVDTDGALDHLDQAIFLLQRLHAHGRGPTAADAKPKLRSA
jgi:hypothetical protein